MTSPPSACGLRFDAPPYRLSGVVVGALMNHAPALAALGAAVHEAPYKAAPRGPILFIKPRNTLAQSGDVVAVPPFADELQIGASLGVVVGRTACRVAERDAIDHVAGYTLVADLGVPHASFYRPSIRLKALDRSCLIGPRVVTRNAIADPDDLAITVSLDGTPVEHARTSGMIRPVARLLADVSDFMTLHAGDVLMLGVALGAPRARAGQTFAIVADGIGRLEGRARERGRRGAAMRTARVAYGGALHEAMPHEAGLRLDDGRVVGEAEVVWLPPFEVGTIIALGLNYADHAKELSKELTVTAKDEPLVFLKTAERADRPPRLHAPAARRRPSCTTNASSRS